jgi:hypothetical protein
MRIFSAGVRALDRLTKPRKVEDKTVKGINFFDPVDNALLHALQVPRVNIAGIRRADLLAPVEQLSPARLSTRSGRSATAALCHVTQSGRHRPRHCRGWWSASPSTIPRTDPECCGSKPAGNAILS